ncbi:hypothetical protein [Cupriavidus sp. amp6]
MAGKLWVTGEGDPNDIWRAGDRSGTA